MSIEAELRREYARAEHREAAVIRVLPYALLAVSTVIALMGPAPAPAVLGLTAVAAGWLVWLGRLDRRPDPDVRLLGLYFAGLTVWTAALVALAPSYGIFAFIGYVHAFLYLRGRWRYVGVVATSLIMAVTYVGGVANIVADDWWLWAAVSTVSVGLSLIFFHILASSDQHGRRQQRALAELHEANLRLEAALAENAGLHAQLLDQAREAGVLDERQRMAREIHDTLAQSLAGILTQLQAAEQTIQRPDAVRRHVTTAVGLARESLVEARRTVHAVEPQVLAGARLPDAIDDVTARWAQVHHIEAALTTTGDPRPMRVDVELTLLRAAQEGLANVAKHAGASRVGLTLSYMEDLVTLDIRDDGVGFDPEAGRADGAGTGGFGLAGMRQRVQRLAGRLDIESEPGGGTAISATVPAIPAGSAR
ncbi:sensor histidine kinase [Occultella glacieicola]|uniref:Oxygen sensor histidine kinase NreB n=1 Tax=Occultella glacieicola TaxID=2518684 RepID=A0ABY2E3A1_9MICO|nr:sensor histidine kinase [Occultella glacieicola]TDE94103.1 sensor histidine kinase [Occultella glacieicola]